MDNKKELVVPAIPNGTVIDHIPTAVVYRVISILGLDRYEDEVLIGNYLTSKKYGRKGIVKVKNKYFTAEQLSAIALLAPTATVIAIKDYEVVSKAAVQVPDHVDDLIRCVNPMCITNHEKIPTRFDVVDKDNLKLRCHYCEKYTEKDAIHFVEHKN
ncbi:MAG: aspartate carbamoyltransferase regulatory subunit [Bacteroidales bacterium]|nr:aspartate carbamoyltransferase regulatory subunit [Bacteroidales bacterium]